ncbi:hypothetical protein HMPREF0326_00593 [Desulfovibrio sp. 3_1_syn3]|uniref:transposase n=1 Tax=Desulfovibrio sp. 3_1_syn3 TaxID=457398 RepID=UPI0001E12477|nr:transposase [Desulfovibrio sp. 3_1_syn3]EFL86819.1 hypothetical protein HMPREF0326_00593 [Desulfovibrio sp. 3_1_syn3]
MAGGKNAFYSVEFKQEAVQRYQEGGIGYRELSEQLELKSKTQLQKWVAAVRRGDSLEDTRGKNAERRKGRPRTTFSSVEEKLAYVEAELEYVKKLYRSRFGHEWGAHKKEFFSK